MILIDGILETQASMKSEAIKRMKMLSIDQEIISQFLDADNVVCSNNGIHFTEVPPEITKQSIEWQQKFGSLVYHVIHAYIFGLETYELLSVSPYKEDWSYENDIIQNGWVMCHSINLTVPEHSESGSIHVVNNHGCLKRIN